MKYTAAILLVIVSILATQCGSRKIIYEFPTGLTSAEERYYQESCDKGRILYDINCGNCHTTTVKGKKVIPDFAPMEIENYSGSKIRISNAKHMEALSDNSITMEQLDLIKSFLRFKKRNPVE